MCFFIHALMVSKMKETQSPAAPSGLGLVLSSASTLQTYFVLRFPILRWFSPLLFIGILQGIAGDIGTSNFPRVAFIVSLNSSWFGSKKEYSSQWSGSVELRFLDSPSLLCLLFRCIRHMLPHIWPYVVWTRGCLFPRIPFSKQA